jgi:hypothetical protein
MKITRILLAVAMFFGTNSYAEEAKDKSKDQKAIEVKQENPEYTKIVADYRKYLETLSESVKEEVVNYRTKNAQLNLQKKKLYKELTVEAQKHLKMEQEYKRKLPIKYRHEIKAEQPVDKKNDKK